MLLKKDSSIHCSLFFMSSALLISIFVLNYEKMVKERKFSQVSTKYVVTMLNTFFISGVNIVLNIDFKESLIKCDPESVPSTKNIPENGLVPIRLEIAFEGIKYHLPKEMQADLPALMKCVNKGSAGLPTQLFGSYRSPFDIKDMEANPGKTHCQFKLKMLCL